MTASDLEELHARLRAVLPKLSIEMGTLEHPETHSRHAALLIEDPQPRKKDHVFQMTIGIIDDKVHFFVHVHGVSTGLVSTRGAQHYSKACVSIDEVFAIVHSCWADGPPS